MATIEELFILNDTTFRMLKKRKDSAMNKNFPSYATATLQPQYTQRWSSVYARSECFRAWLEDEPVDVFTTRSAHFAIVCVENMATFRLQAAHPVAEATISPQHRGVQSEKNGFEIVIRVQPEDNLFIQVPGLPRFYLFASRPEAKPAEVDGVLHHIRQGELVETDCLELRSGDCLFVEHGGIFRGAIRAYEAQNVKICGNGLIDGIPHLLRRTPYQHLLRFEGCRNVEVRNVTLIQPRTWTHVLYGSENVLILNIHQIGDGCGNDGIDIMNSRNVWIEGGFIHSGDDCIAVKAQCLESANKRVDGVDYRSAYTMASEDIVVNGLTVLNDGGGNALEIGHELRCDTVQNILFKNIDILGVHGHGAAFSIHNCDRATVQNIVYRNIRVEHYYEKLFSLRVTKSRYHFDREYGRIRNILFDHLRIREEIYNPGYSCSVIGGHDAEHQVESVHFRNVTLGERLLRNMEDWDCYTRFCSGLTFSA